MMCIVKGVFMVLRVRTSNPEAWIFGDWWWALNFGFPDSWVGELEAGGAGA